MKSATIEKETIKIKFGGSDFSESLKRIKSLEGRKYNPTEKNWIAPTYPENIEALINWGFLSSESKTNSGEVIPEEEIVFKNIEIPGLLKPLYGFQKEGVRFLELAGGRGLIGDEMGLGKTIQALAYLQLHPELRPAIIVCPASLKLNWEKEIESTITTKKETKIISGRNGATEQADILIINYDILDARLHQLNPKIVVLDECHQAKNPKAVRTKAVIKLCKKTNHIIALSGTPITSRPIEFHNTLKLIDPSFPTRWDFAKRYCGLRHNGFGWDMSGATRTEELHKKINKKTMIRRKKEEVLKQLPQKRRVIIPLEIDNDKEYSKAISNFQNSEKGLGDFAKIEELKQIAVEGKKKQIFDWIDDFIDSGEKLVLFCTHTKILNSIMEKYSEISVKVDGSVSIENRQKNVDEFQTNQNIKLFVGNLKAAGVGLTLTASSNVVFLELGWTPGEMIQAEDRVHRIGQENSVTAYYLIAQNTLEVQIMNMLEKKAQTLQQILDGAEKKETSIFADLLKEIRNC